MSSEPRDIEREEMEGVPPAASSSSFVFLSSKHRQPEHAPCLPADLIARHADGASTMSPELVQRPEVLPGLFPLSSTSISIGGGAGYTNPCRPAAFTGSNLDHIRVERHASVRGNTVMFMQDRQVTPRLVRSTLDTSTTSPSPSPSCNPLLLLLPVAPVNPSLSEVFGRLGSAPLSPVHTVVMGLDGGGTSYFSALPPTKKEHPPSSEETETLNHPSL